MTTLAVRHVSKTYGSGHLAVHAVRDVSFEVAEGEIVVIMGRSGSGKTTLLTLVGSLLRPTSGQIVISGRDLDEASDRELAAFRLRTIGFVFQSFNLLSALTAEQNVAVPLLAAGTPRKQASRTARELLDGLGLAERGRHLPRELSGGERQRVALARGIALDPALLLADEPTANLDSSTAEAVAELLCGMVCRSRRAAVIVTHDEQMVRIASRVLRMHDGAITQEEPGRHDDYCPHCARQESGGASPQSPSP